MQRYARELLNALDHIVGEREGVSVRLLTPRLNAELPPLRHIRHQAVGRLHGHAWEQIELPRHVGQAILFCPGNTAPLASLVGKSRVVVTVHDLSYLYFPDAYSQGFRLLYHTLIPFILRKADRVITVSQSEAAAIARHYPHALERLVAIQNGGSPIGFDEQESNPVASPTVLYVGSLSRRKNFPAMLEAAIDLARRRGVHFNFVGSVPQGLTATLAEIPGDLTAQIRFSGQVDDWSELLCAYRQATCFLFPSLYEASPLPPIEAMGCGCPVVAGDIPSLRERCGDAALYCDPANVSDIVRAVEMVLDSPELRNRLRVAGYEQARRYSWKNCAEATLEVIMSGGNKFPTDLSEAAPGAHRPPIALLDCNGGKE